MGAALLILELIILAAVCVYLLHIFVAFKRTPWYALISTWLGWLLCFSIVFLIPIDILNMDFDACVKSLNHTLPINNTLPNNGTIPDNTTTPTTLPTSLPTLTPITTTTTTGLANYYAFLLDENNTTMMDNTTIMDNITATCHRPFTSLPDDVMRVQWAILWWGTMLLSWLGFPLLSSFFQAGHFTVWERCVRAIKENIVLYRCCFPSFYNHLLISAIHYTSLFFYHQHKPLFVSFDTLRYCILGAIGVIAVIALYIKSGLTQEAFLGLMLSLANAYGLVLTVVLMGYGLVDIPRYLWRKANRASTLRYYCVMAYKYKEGIENAKADLLKTMKVVRAITDIVRDHHPYRKEVDIILSKCPVDYEEVTAGGEVEISHDKLVSVHQKVNEHTHAVARAVILYEQMCKRAFKVEDVLRTQTHPQSDYKIYWSFIPDRKHRFAKIVDAMEYMWEVWLFTSILRVFSVVFGILSILIVWSEITLTVEKHNLSPFAHMVAPLHGFSKQLICLLIIFYMALCAYTTLFKIKIFNFYRLVPHQMSDAGSIMFSANYLCRLAAPLAYNFLSLVHIPDDNFSSVMGDMTATGLGRKFLIGFPVLVVILCLATIFNVYSKIGAMCCIKSLRYRPDDDELLADQGEKILQDERELKEGRGAVQLKIKETIRSSIRREVGNIAKNQSEDSLHEKEAAQMVEPVVVPPRDDPPTLYSSMANKYGIRSNSSSGDLPAVSRFAKRNSIESNPSAATGMRQNLSSNDLGAAETSAASIRHNLSSNNLSAQGGAGLQSTTSTSTFSKFLTPFSNPATTTTSTARVTTPATTTTTVPTIPAAPSLQTSASSSSTHSRSTSLLPPTSRFAQRPPSPNPPAPAPAAILISGPADDMSPPPTSSASSKSLLGGFFSKPKFELVPNKSPNASLNRSR